MLQTQWLCLTALLSAPFVFGAGCSPKVDLGSMATCSDDGVVCDLDGGFSDAALPIGASMYPAFDGDAFVHVSEAMEGKWHGVVAGAEMISPRFEMSFAPDGGDGSGAFHVRCVESRLCVPIGKVDDGSTEGEYRIAYVDGDRTGQGEFTWTDETKKSARFRSLLLRESDEVLFFVVDFPPLGSFQFVMRSGPWPDAGVAEPDASAPDPEGPRSSIDAGNATP
jgi:hypothetical protein